MVAMADKAVVVLLYRPSLPLFYWTLLKTRDERLTRSVAWLACWWRFSSLESPVSIPESSSPTRIELVTLDDDELTEFDPTNSFRTSVTCVKKSGTPS